MKDKVTAARHVCAGVFLVIAAVFLAPPLVRAMPLRGPDAPPIRLNRGFEQPPAKCDVTPSAEVVIEPADLSPSPDAGDPGVLGSSPDRPFSYSPPDRSPDTLRGPPPVRLS